MTSLFLFVSQVLLDRPKCKQMFRSKLLFTDKDHMAKRVQTFKPCDCQTLAAGIRFHSNDENTGEV